jgi:hypothetical protein
MLVSYFPAQNSTFFDFQVGAVTGGDPTTRLWVAGSS